MIRKIVHIDEEKCNGCGQCIDACHEGALRLVGGVAKLVSDVYCDGLGDCLGECPQGAIRIEEREAAAFDEAAVKARLGAPAKPAGCPAGGCPGTALRTLGAGRPSERPAAEPAGDQPSRLGHWPIQLKLVPPSAPFLRGADIVVSADCAGYALPGLHERYLSGRAVLIGCPKLDDVVYYREKLAAIFGETEPASITVLRMEVPCCAAIARAAVDARNEAAPDVPTEIHTVSIRGDVTRETVPTLDGRH